MPDFSYLRRIRVKRPLRQDFEPRTLMDMLLDQDQDQGQEQVEGRAVQVSAVTVSFFGFRAQSHGRTGFAALKHMYRDHPVLVRCLRTYLGAMWTVTAAVATQNLF
ncbi:hypothetical protein [Streptomyces olivaceus]|uniref:hypothetical protein n=1 Tax=Streptomyces olivaceus TaxID=47716 RepID=UPI0022EDBCC6|nr:hypothetical protein [Streptomyces olivaceus]GHI98049.1 hypothetical protein TPA0905_75200 [Streptomyces olivaceus]